MWGRVEWRRLQAGEVFQTNAPAGGSAGWTQRGGGVYVSFKGGVVGERAGPLQRIPA